MRVEFNLRIVHESRDTIHPYRVEDRFRTIYRFCKTWDEAKGYISVITGKGGA